MKFLQPVYEMCDGSYGGFTTRNYETYLMGLRRQQDASRWWMRLFG